MPAALEYTFTGVAPKTTVSVTIYGYPVNAFVGFSIQAFDPNVFPGIPGEEPYATIDSIQSEVYRDSNSLTTVPAYILTITNQSPTVTATIQLFSLVETVS